MGYKQDTLREMKQITEPHYGTIWLESGRNPNDMRQRPDVVDEIIETGRRHVDGTARTYELPFDADDVVVGVCEHVDHGVRATVTPIDCGIYNSVWGEWTVTEQPSEYVVLLPLQFWENSIGNVQMGKSVRHELAHVADWHENLQTTEKTDTHLEWMKRLDAIRE